MFLCKTLFIKAAPRQFRVVDGGELVNETGRCTNRCLEEKTDMKEKKIGPTFYSLGFIQIAFKLIRLQNANSRSNVYQTK